MDAARRAVVLGGGAVMLGACSPLQIFDALAPRDAGVSRVASETYGSDPRQALDVYAPARGAEAGRALPTVVFFYGGSWDSGARAEYSFVGQALAAQGFLAVLPDYRLYPQVRFPGFLEDGAAAIRWTRDNAARFGGDGRRIVLVGHSAGAYNAAMLALDGRWLRRAGVEPRTVRGFAGLSGPYDFLPLEDETTIKVFGGAPDLPATQPVSFVRRGAPSAFLATGDRDTTVRPRNTASLTARYRAAGASVEEHVYPGLDHKDTLLALSVPFRGRAPELAELAGFLRRTAGP